MQNPYSKFILAIKTLIFDRFSKFLQALLQQIGTKMLNKNIFYCPSAIENSRQKFIIWGQFLHYNTISWLKFMSTVRTC